MRRDLATRHWPCILFGRPAPHSQRRLIMLGKICIKPVITASTQMTVADAARAMRSKNVGALVVVNAGRPVGMLTDRDIAIEVVAKGMDPATARVGDVMH